MTPDCLDHNQHVHYKIYILKAIEYIADACDGGLLAFRCYSGFHSAQFESVSVVFNKDSTEGDRLVFTLLKAEEERSVYVTIQKDQEDDILVYIKVQFYDDVIVKLPKVQSLL